MAKIIGYAFLVLGASVFFAMLIGNFIRFGTADAVRKDK